MTDPGVVLGFIIFILATLLLFFFLINISVCVFKIITWRPCKDRNVELGQRRSNERTRLATSSRTGYKRLTEPEIKNGKLYGQDYFTLKEHFRGTNLLFRDDKVKVAWSNHH